MPIVDIGKTIATTRLSDGSVLNLFNHTIIGENKNSGVDAKYYDVDGKLRYSLSIESKAVTNKYRCAYYSRSFPQSPHDMKPRLVLVVDDDCKVSPLYEFITPSIMNVQQDTIQLSWWSNVFAEKFDDEEGYDSDALVRFSSTNLYLDTNVSSYKILCTATIRWQYLKQNGAGVEDDHYHRIPVIGTPAVSAVIKNEGYVLDFETGSGGGGNIGLHTHTSNDDGGFAAAVFMPSAFIRPVNWR